MNVDGKAILRAFRYLVPPCFSVTNHVLIERSPQHQMTEKQMTINGFTFTKNYEVRRIKLKLREEVKRLDMVDCEHIPAAASAAEWIIHNETSSCLAP